MTIYKDSRTAESGSKANEIAAESQSGSRAARVVPEAVRVSAEGCAAEVSTTRDARDTEDQAEYIALIEACRSKGTGSRVYAEEDMRRSARVKASEINSAGTASCVETVFGAEVNSAAEQFSAGSILRSRANGRDPGRGGRRRAAGSRRGFGAGSADNASLEKMLLLLGGMLIVSGTATGAIAWRDTADVVSATDLPAMLALGTRAFPSGAAENVLSVCRSVAPFFAAIAIGSFFAFGGLLCSAALFLFGMGLGYSACLGAAEGAMDAGGWALLLIYALFTVFSLIMLAKDSCILAGRLFRHGYAEGSKKGRLLFTIRAAVYALLIALGGLVQWCAAVAEKT